MAIDFSKSGDNLVLTNSLGKIVVYETKNVIKFDFAYDYQLKSFQMTQLTVRESEQTIG